MNLASEFILNSPKLKKILKDGPPPLSQCNILGVGTFGIVCKAIHKGKPVALKIVKNCDGMNAKTLQNEAEILGWRHRNIVQTLKIVASPNFGVVIMERFPGECLQRVVDTVALPLMHRVLITMDILSALSYCHTRGRLLHLDVKPQNVLVAWERTRPNLKSTPARYICKLCDFGASIKTGTLDVTTKKHKIVKGTVRYMSPEALRGEQLSPAADIYSLGVTMWHLFHRRIPYSWIECNDVVAYQVVKNNLRPDAENFPQPNLAQRSMAQFKNVVNRKRKANKENDPPAFEEPAKVMKPINFAGRRAFQDVNANAANELATQNMRPETDANVISDLPNWAERFQSIGHVESLKAEEVYVDIFKFCWNSDYRDRPNAVELCKRLERLLM